MLLNLSQPVEALSVNVKTQTITHHTIPAGEYRAEITKSPLAYGSSNWLVFKDDGENIVGAYVDCFKPISSIKVRKSALFIDDDPAIIMTLRLRFKGRPDFIFVRCQSVGEALVAIRNHKTDLIFLDHDLAPNGNEGFQIIKELKIADTTAEIYSMAMNHEAMQTYAQLGIKHINKTNSDGILKVSQEL